MSSDCVCERCGYDGFHCDCLLRHGTLFDAACADIIKKKYADFVAAYKFVGAVRAFHCDADTVCIRVRRKHQVCACFFCEIQSLLQRCKNLRVRIAAGRKVAVRILLIRHDRDVCDANVFEYLCYWYESGTVQRAVYQLQASCFAETRTHLTGFNRLIKCFFAVILHETDQSFFHALCKGHIFCSGQYVGLLDLVVNDRCRVICHLAAVRTVCLVTVVFCRIVGCGHHDSCVAVVVTGRKGKCRYRHQCIVDPYMNTVCRQHTCRCLGKHVALETAVIADCHGLCTALCLHPVCKSLRRLAYHIDVHAVRTCAKHAAQSRGTELQCYGKTLLYFVFISFDSG